MKSRIVGTLMAFCLLLPVYAFAASTLTDKYSDDEVVQIIKDEGYSAVTRAKKGLIVVKIDGRAYTLINMSDGDLQCYYGMSGVKVSYEDINIWNRTKRLSRAYIDSHEDPVLESDLLSNGGLTKKNVSEFFHIFVNSVRAYREFLMEHDKS